MKHSLQLPHSELVFSKDESKIFIEVHNLTDGMFYSDCMDAEQLHDLIGTLLHIQSKIRSNGNR